ncbi:hypothetical protein DL766_003046 [Monosporascus sp. MC13-8B]|uniref:F-box domain-containing protein n=1 Tax=Monosporascus cannonballus TaxID=155416 RepID=A0ABY0H7H1_9PEZI|nr:hypothetical protein DL762_004701 [Monosporascus cannonballus]RYO98752.1 hypothetical protein DL763_002013 [Monosporascus cannonballus]RYP34397.1 hypothetical protein DL766_003046 [Monosporascus sp. MC13-8B]
MPSLKDLPNELLISIVSSLPVHTKKVFRLTCRAYEPIPLPFLFRRIRLSRLREDIGVFERIATHSQLRVHVRELVWYKLELEAWRAPRPDDMALDDGDYAFMRQLVRAAASDWQQQLLSYVNNVTPLYNTEIGDTSQLSENDRAVVVTEKGGMSKVERIISDRDDYDDYADYEFWLPEGNGEEDDKGGNTEEGDEEEGSTENKKEDGEGEGEGDEEIFNYCDERTAVTDDLLDFLSDLENCMGS